MRNYIILNGVNSNTITGLLISTLPPITKPKIRTQTEEIDGRDGDIVTKLGYSAYDKTIEIGLYGNFDIDEVIAYFNSEGTIVFSNEPDKYYNYQILDQIDYEKLIRFKTAKVKMHVQPFKYPLEETPVEINIQNVTNEAEEMSLNNTAEAPLTLALKGNTSQDGTPTPDAPVEVKTVAGGQEIVVCGKNINSKGIRKGLYQTLDGAYSNYSGYVTTNDLIPIKYGNTITVSSELERTEGNFAFYLLEYGENKNYLNVSTGPIYNKKTATFTITNQNTKYIAVDIGGSATVDNVGRIQIEKGSTATTYEPYKSQSYEINIGKNLADISKVQAGYINTTGGISGSTPNAEGYIRYIPVQQNTTYTFNIIETPSSFEQWLGIAEYSSQSESSFLRNSVRAMANVPYTFTTGANTQYLCVSGRNILYATKVQLERNSVATSYAPYKTPELCKIGDYQDRIYKDNNKWYLEKKIGKTVFDGTETWVLQSINSSGIANFAYDNSGAYSSTSYIKSNYFKNQTSAIGNTTESGIFNNANTIYVRIDQTTANTVANFKTWLGTHNTSVYYVLATPEVTEITDIELIGQLETLKQARSYDTTTNISQNTANKPFILNATAVQKGTDTATVDNEGNIYAKPTIDIEGSGAVEVYLNNNQIFTIDLSNNNECIIDTTNLEAYDPDTSQLMNRQVTGDYSNFVLNTGENQVKVSGNVTKATISKYTRWL